MTDSQIAVITNRLTGYTIDKSNWPDGPWKTEPDSLLFDSHGYACEIKRHHSIGHLCGYVVVPADHPMAGGKDDIKLDVHGGITFSQLVDDGHGYMLGFDCGHAYDYSPGIATFVPGMRMQNVVYRTIEYARQQVEHLAEQLAAACRDTPHG